MGDTLHITQGQEIENCMASGNALHITTIDLGRRAEGSLWLALPARPLKATCNGVPVDCVAGDSGIYRVGLDFKDKAELVIEW